MIVTLGLARLQVIFVLNHFSRLGNQMFPIKQTKVGVILNSWEMWQAGFSLAASPLASRGGPVASKVPREEDIPPATQATGPLPNMTAFLSPQRALWVYYHP